MKISEKSLSFLDKTKQLSSFSFGEQVEMLRELVTIRFKNESENLEYHLFLTMRNINKLTISHLTPQTVAESLKIIKDKITKIIL